MLVTTVPLMEMEHDWMNIGLNGRWRYTQMQGVGYRETSRDNYREMALYHHFGFRDAFFLARVPLPLADRTP